MSWTVPIWKNLHMFERREGYRWVKKEKKIMELKAKQGIAVTQITRKLKSI